MSHDPYIGVGIVYIEKIGSSEGLIDIGNDIKFSNTPNISSVEQKNYRNVAGGLYAEEKTNDGDQIDFEVGGLRVDNLTRATGGILSASISGTETDEEHTANLDRFISLSKLPSSISDVNTLAAGAGTSFTPDTDYILRPGGIFIPATSTIPDASQVFITYTSKASDVIEAALNTSDNYRIVFAGQNKAQSGKELRIEVYKVPLVAGGEINYIGDDFATLSFSGKTLPDTTKNGTTESQYYKVVAEQ